MKVLVVDESATARRMTKALLTRIGYADVEEVSSGTTALQKLRGSTFGLIIAAWAMEPMTGLQLLREVRGDSSLSGIPFIMVMPDSSTEKVLAAKEAGVNNYVVKPFDADTLNKKIQPVLAS